MLPKGEKMMISATGFCHDAVVVGVRFLQPGRWRLVSPPCLHHRSSSLLPSTTCMVLQPPDVGQLAETARITLSPGQVDAFAPKIRQVVDWFGQLQEVNLEKFEPAVRADTEINVQPREDLQETFKNREAILASVPSFEEPYITVPKVLNAECIL